jgi:hypothetical protein
LCWVADGGGKFKICSACVLVYGDAWLNFLRLPRGSQ